MVLVGFRRIIIRGQKKGKRVIASSFKPVRRDQSKTMGSTLKASP